MNREHTSSSTWDHVPDQALRRAVEAAPDGVLVVDDAGRILFANPMLCEIFGYTPEELVGRPVEMLLPEALREGHTVHRKEFAQHPRTRPMGSGLDLRGRRRDGTEVPVEIGLSPLPGTSPPQVLGIVRDVTERRLAGEALQRAHEELALVDDRERIARDLHDTVIQRLFAVGLSLQSAMTRAPGSEVAERLETAIDEIDGTIRDIRTAIFALHARRASTSGPRDDVLAIAHEAARTLGFEPHVQFDGLVDAVMPDSVREQLLPTLREALSNVAKHAGATRVEILLAVDDGVRLVVADNGGGIAETTTGGRGLGNMAERAELLGGSCRVEPGGRNGTRVEWSVPLHRSA